MNYTGLTKIALRTFLGFLGLTAAIAIVSVLGGKFGELQAKFIGSTFTISLASICSMSCAAFIARKTRTAIGLSGIGLAVVSAILVIAGIWPEINSEGYWKTTASCGIATLACAHGFLLVIPELGERKKWFQQVSFASVVVLALLVVVAMWGDIGEEVYYRFMAAVAIVVGLETVSLPILMKLNKAGGPRRQLMLKELEDGIYIDPAGRKYHVKELDPEPCA
ncbi:hypothetical protein PDESU_06072 [Pontiella desulfatans]|uniref:Uncharacterized protein n=1 Tax=Pontiella desulfatans TaxID=2750659 RepID=A0A6C2UE34_PONDE|nr:hypothetical protein [Pontiella desulfatans]VGO17476.1 hypothetical protein PDESU_06072 [Pontiella desulfatans]